MTNWYGKVDTRSQSGEFTSLPEGIYTTNQKVKVRAGTSLFVIKAIDPKPVGDGSTTRHTLLIGSDDEKGTAFLKIDLKPLFLHPEAIALAMKKRDAEIAPEVIQHLDTDVLAAVDAQIRKEAEDKVVAANTPDEAFADAVEKAVSNTLLQIQINIGTIFRLCDWAGVERDPNVDLSSFVQLHFSGTVKHKSTNQGGESAEVSVHSRPTNAVPLPQGQNQQTSFDPASFS